MPETQLAAIMAGLPAPAAQRLALACLAARLEPVCQAHQLPPYRLIASRARRTWGSCRRPRRAGQLPTISVRCTRPDAEHRWLRVGTITYTLLHELAHLRYPHHRPLFWTFYRVLVDDAVQRRALDPLDFDADVIAAGDLKLTGSAGEALAESSRAHRARLRAQARNWPLGQRVRLVGLGPRSRYQGVAGTVVGWRGLSVLIEPRPGTRLAVRADHLEAES